MKKWSYCSQHKHRFKHNLFYVESGKIRVKAWKNDYDLIDKTVLSKGQKTDIPPTEKHRFEALDDSVAFEIYFSEPIGKDIERFDCGGVNFRLLEENKGENLT